MTAPTSITCPECGATSRHPDDIAASYCGRCRWWTGDPFLVELWREMWPERVAVAHAYLDPDRRKGDDA